MQNETLRMPSAADVDDLEAELELLGTISFSKIAP
jgi:hypothetical protein